MTTTHALVAVYAAYSSMLCKAYSHPAELLHGRLTACLVMSYIFICMGRSQLSGMAHSTKHACTCILQHAATSRDCSCLRYTSSIVQRSLLQALLVSQSAEQWCHVNLMGVCFSCCRFMAVCPCSASQSLDTIARP